MFSLEALELVDSPSESLFDNLTALASQMLDAEISLLSFVQREKDRQYFKSMTGFTGPCAEARETPLSHSFCKHVVYLNRPLAVDDARKHALVRDNPAITDLNVEAYLGVPVRDPLNRPIAALCVIETKPRAWNETSVDMLERLAECVTDAIRLRYEMQQRVILQREQSDFCYALSHDLRSPVATLQYIHNELIPECSINADPETRELLSVASATLNLADRLIVDIATYSQSLHSAETPVWIDLNSLVGDAINTLQEDQAHTGARFSVDELPHLCVRPTQCRMLFQNLLSNAMKFHSPGKPPTIRVRGTEWDETVEIIVSDDGIGIRPEYHEMVFRVFKRLNLDKDYPGSGLGLALIRHVVLAHGGTISVESDGVVGTAFTLQFPKPAHE